MEIKAPCYLKMNFFFFFLLSVKREQVGGLASARNHFFLGTAEPQLWAACPSVQLLKNHCKSGASPTRTLKGGPWH